MVFLPFLFSGPRVVCVVPVFLRAFLCSLQVVVLMHQRWLQCWKVLFLILFLIRIVCQRHLWDVMSYARSLVFLFSGHFLNSSLVHFKNGPEYLTRGTAQVFIPLIRILQYSFVSSCFLVLLRYSFLIFSFNSTCLVESASQVFLAFLFFMHSDFFLIRLFHSVRQVSFSAFHF